MIIMYSPAHPTPTNSCTWATSSHLPNSPTIISGHHYQHYPPIVPTPAPVSAIPRMSPISPWATPEQAARPISPITTPLTKPKPPSTPWAARTAIPSTPPSILDYNHPHSPIQLILSPPKMTPTPNSTLLQRSYTMDEFSPLVWNPPP